MKAGIADRRPDAATIRKRLRIYIPVATVLTLGMLAGIYGFVNTEQTALTTVPPQENAPEIFVPQTPTPTPGGFTPGLDANLGAILFENDL